MKKINGQTLILKRAIDPKICYTSYQTYLKQLVYLSDETKIKDFTTFNYLQIKTKTVTSSTLQANQQEAAAIILFI